MYVRHVTTLTSIIWLWIMYKVLNNLSSLLILLSGRFAFRTFFLSVGADWRIECVGKVLDAVVVGSAVDSEEIEAGKLA